MRGKFIVLEGCEGVGKSTQLRFLKEYLERTGQDAVYTREPGGTPLAEKIREIILTSEMDAETEALLFAAARCDHIQHKILPAMDEGKLVVCDRYLDSSLAYQGFGRDLGYDKVLEINDYAVKHCLPDGVVFIDMNPLDSSRRRKGHVVENDRMEREKDEFHLRVYEGLKHAEKNRSNFLSIVPEVEKDATHRKIVDALRSRGLIR